MLHRASYFEDSKQGPVMASCKHGNQALSPVRGGEFLDQLSNKNLLKKDSDPWRREPKRN
jgi:hypothetical protein